MNLKKFLMTGLFVALFVMLFCIAASAEVYSGRALDEEFILSNEGETEIDPNVKLELEDGKMIDPCTFEARNFLIMEQI